MDDLAVVTEGSLMGTVGVVGGGVAGLAAAHYLLRKPSVTRCECHRMVDSRS